MLYRKILRLSEPIRQQVSVGNVSNLVFKDTLSICGIHFHLAYCVMYPILMVAGSVILIRNIVILIRNIGMI
ncbi:hypothetical protein KIPB_015603 [Kipferlia bialata]|uniref:Uncharacterized protein n=1 Tax=Kipferlia bialata TaxID=797122 RepID=A0A9K3DAS0_9EUKA|nr:hypothetical protein KIPB_015603 [Kipferlia bialata]|eukprot:g15603.t1